MKVMLLLLPALCVTPALAQNVEFSGRAGVNLLRFSGEGATASALAVDQDNSFSTPGDYTFNPCGKKLGAGFGASVRAQRVGQRGLLAAVEVGYDWLQSRTSVDRYYPFYDTGFAPNPATGTTQLRVQQASVFAGIGQRFGKGRGAVQFDVAVGPEWAVLFGVREKGQGTYSTLGPDEAWQTDNAIRLARKQDVRLRADFTAWCHRLGLTASYAVGLTNHQDDFRYDFAGIYPNGAVYSRTLRLGLAYRLR